MRSADHQRTHAEQRTDRTTDRPADPRPGSHHGLAAWQPPGTRDVVAAAPDNAGLRVLAAGTDPDRLAPKADLRRRHLESRRRAATGRGGQLDERQRDPWPERDVTVLALAFAKNGR
ncbi:hypothetical protein Ahu01nite_008360 [Winogradskya humida]|uniref:Uncharacterized protein n=1 Tax=Winogradskya humida TaxID=113566 RepID=A0ABQ3ZGM5_9ACTN|nr:hypothetical protein Ahu01nite_008360 [Actinoplanes humidus]